MAADRIEVPGRRRQPSQVPPALDPELVDRLVEASLREDVGSGDITTLAVVEPAARARGLFLAKEPLVVCGLPFAGAVFARLDPDARVEPLASEGAHLAEGTVFARVEAGAQAVLTGERIALNFLQRLSGIATLASAAVNEVRGTAVTILDTRKTTPTLRAVEKYAVRVGGAENHRAGLFDAVLVKDNHLALAGGIRHAVERLSRSGRPPASVEVEVEDLAGVDEALACGVGRLLLDNMTPELVAEAVRRIGGRAKVEVSGGLRAGRLRAWAETGVDYLSLGSLTHSARAVDISLEVEPLP